MLGIPIGTVRTRIFRAREFIARRLEPARRVRALRADEHPAEQAGPERQPLPHRPPARAVERPVGHVHHLAVGGQQVLEALGHAPPRRLGLPIELSRVEAAEHRVRFDAMRPRYGG